MRLNDCCLSIVRDNHFWQEITAMFYVRLLHRLRRPRLLLWHRVSRKHRNSCSLELDEFNAHPFFRNNTLRR